LSQRFEGLDQLSCECRSVWERHGVLEPLGLTA
jgi:hypothetical protein